MTTAQARGGMPARQQRVSPDAKRAARVADRIVADVTARGWPAGELLGSEAELLDRYQVSRAVFREAVRLVEHQQVARTRRGPGGGLVITEPTVDAVTDAVVLYLYRVQARLDELLEARIVLEEITSDLAPRRLDEAGLARLRAFVTDGDPRLGADPVAMHALVASMAGNPALELFTAVLGNVMPLYSSGWQNFGPAIAAGTAAAHTRIARAVIAGEPGLARDEMRAHLAAEAGYLRRRRSTRQLLPDSVIVLREDSNGKRAEAVARRITQAVVGDALRPGQLIGTEPELIARESVSRAVLREAVRLLEHHQVARMRRGPGGGLFVYQPSADAVTDMVSIYLARRGMRPADLGELRACVEVSIAGLAASRIEAASAERLREALRREQNPDAGLTDEEHDLHAAVARCAGNRVLELIALVLIRLRPPRRGSSQPDPDVRRAHEGIAAAVQAGDRDLARHRMRWHLESPAGARQ